MVKRNSRSGFTHCRKNVICSVCQI